LDKKSKIILTVAPLVLALDRLTKLLVAGKVGIDQEIPVINGFFNIVQVHNTGTAFGMFSASHNQFRTPFLAVSTLLALALLFYFAKKTRQGDTLTLIAIALIIGGAAGNLLDRLTYGYVIDFIDWYIGSYHWPSFNIADSGITVGVFILAVEVFVRGKSMGTDSAPGGSI